MNQISDERRAELQKIRNCLPFMTPEAGLSETTQAFDELIGAYTELVDLREEYNASLAAICDLAHALGFDPDVWDHDSCPNNSEMVHELIGHVGLMIAKALASFERVPDISEPYPTGVVIYPSEAIPFLAPALEAAAREITGKSIKAINRRIAMARLENIKSLEDPGL